LPNREDVKDLPINRPKSQNVKPSWTHWYSRLETLLKSSIEVYKYLKQKNAWTSGIFYIITNSLQQSKNESFILVNTT
jgi:hypothetical protein